MEIKFKKLNENATVPTRGSEESAGCDLYACIPSPVTILPHQTMKIPTGLAMEIPKGYFGAIVARSGLATKRGLAPANKIGVCDSDYRGEYIVALHNDSDTAQTINPSDRIAQLLILPYLNVTFKSTDVLIETKRGSGGFGSTGI